MVEVKDRSKNWSTGRVNRHPNRRKQESLTAGERRRLTQLLVCLLLFGLVFMGRGLPEGHFLALEQTVSTLVHQNTDFRAAFSRVGQSVSEGEPFVETFGVFFSGVFGNGQQDAQGQNGAQTPENGGLPPDMPGQVPAVEGDAGADNGQNVGESPPPGEQAPSTEPAGDGAKTPETAPAPAASKQESILSEDTVTPVMGILTSGFGYRTHPIDGEYKHHDGIDIMADEGTPIKVFAAGEVEYIGESPAYGLYLQVKHHDGVSTFYAHCKEIVVKTGQKVKAGDVIATVGQTGNVTGAHLHLEVKKDGQRVDPALYVETKTQ